MAVAPKGFKRAEIRVPEIDERVTYVAYNTRTGETLESVDLGNLLRKVAESMARPGDMQWSLHKTGQPAGAGG